MVSPVQRPPTMAVTCDVLISLSAAFPAAVASHAPSAESSWICWPESTPPAALISEIASLAPLKIGGVKLSIGPVKPPRKPSFTSAKAGVAAISAVAATAVRSILEIVMMSLCCALHPASQASRRSSLGRNNALEALPFSAPLAATFAYFAGMSHSELSDLGVLSRHLLKAGALAVLSFVGG